MKKIFGRNTREYIRSLKYFLILIFLITIGETILIAKNFVSPTSFNPLAILKIILILITGWKLGKDKFTYSQIIFSGVLIFLVGGWPIFIHSKYVAFTFMQRIITIVILTIINLVIYIILILFGGWSGKLFNRWKK